MTCNIRDMASWEALRSCAASVWELPLWSEDNDTGTVTVSGDLPDFTGHWLCINGGIYLIDKTSPGNGTTKLTVSLPRTAFSRKLVYSGEGAETYGTFIAAVLDAEYVNQPDEIYALPYLSVVSSDETAFSFPVESGKEYKLEDIMAAAEAAGVRFAWKTSPDDLTLTITTGTRKTINLFDKTSAVQVESASFSGSIVAKVTVRRAATDTAPVSSTDWYLQPDGTASRTPPSPRLPGKWDSVTVSGTKTNREAAIAAFEKNSASYKVVLRTTRSDLSLGDTAMLRYAGSTRSVRLSTCIVSNSDTRLKIKCGTMAATLTDTLRAVARELGGNG